MGGAAGHMMHPYDDTSLTFKDIKKLTRLALKGKLENPLEKFDGYNLFFTYNHENDTFLYARNKSQLVNPILLQDLKKEVFAKAGAELEKQFRLACNSAELYLMFGNAYRFINLEIMNRETINVIDYDTNIICFHEFITQPNPDIKYEIWCDDRRLDEDYLIEDLHYWFTKSNSQYKFISGNPLKIQKSKLYYSQKKTFFKDLKWIQKEHTLKNHNTIHDYLHKEWEHYMHNHLIADPLTIDKFISRWLDGDKSYSLKDIKNDFKEAPCALKIILGIENNLSLIRNEILADLKLYFIKLGINTIERSLDSIAIKDYTAAQKKLIELISMAYDAVSKEVYNKHEYNFKMLESVDLEHHIIPCEGIVFTYKNSKYKLTGVFGALNQIIGSVKYSK